MNDRPPALLLGGWSEDPTKRLEILIDQEAARDVECRTSVGAIVKRLAVLIEWGAFPAGEVVPRHLEPSSARFDAGMESVAWLEVPQADYRSSRVLRNLLAKLYTGLRAVQRLEVREQTDKPIGSWRVESADEVRDISGYPPRVPDPLAFSLTEEDAADMVKNRRCVVTLAAPFSDETLESLLTRLEAWTWMVEQGGYGPPPGEAETERSSLHAYDDRSVELVLSLYESSEAGWYSLLNLLHRFSQTVSQIDDVTIE